MSKVIHLDAESFLASSLNHLIVDVRSPAEFEHAHIPGAENFPLFNNEQRAEIGTLYKKQGREVAMMRGLELYGGNMKQIIEKLQTRNLTGKKLFVHCWRGGMRSGVVSWMLSLFGYHVSILNGGYKAYRQFVLNSFNQNYSFKIIGGRTGAAKTKVIEAMMENKIAAIDLEGIANHRGSAFGAIGLGLPPTQEQFENELSSQLMNLKSEQSIYLEDESQRIGWVNIPNNIWNQMRSADVLYLDIPFENRLENLVNTYGKLEVEQLNEATLRIQKKLGGLQTKNVTGFLKEGNLKEAFRILLNYYDKMYDLGTGRRLPQSIFKIKSEVIIGKENMDKLLLLSNQKPDEWKK